MLKVGLIGKIDAIETVAAIIGLLPGAHVIGKASTGYLSRNETSGFSIPELNRADLIEKSDVLIFTQGARVEHDHLYEIIKKSKSIFSSDFPDFSTAELSEVEKLLNESKSIFQFHNPFYYHPVIRWIRSNFRLPGYFDLNLSQNTALDKKLIMKLLLLPIGYLGVNPSKFRYMSLDSSADVPGFTNIRFEYSDSSVFNFNISWGNSVNEVSLNAFSGKHHLTCNLIANTIEHDRQTVHPENSGPSEELNDFFGCISGRSAVKTGILQYGSILQTVTEISRKSNWPEL